jgi:protein-ribulosamine 3-kinase
MSEADAAVERALSLALGSSPVRVLRRTPLGGGSINETSRIETTAGTFVVKSHDRAPARMFQAEAEGLRAVQASGTTLRVPEVVAIGAESAGRSFIVLEYLAGGRRGADFDESLGRGLAELHRATSARFGFEADNFCGDTPQPNPWTGTWVEFYAQSRLGYQLRLAADAGHVSGTERQQVDALISNLARWVGEPANGPSLIHGDLWSGNLHSDAEGRPALIDPAAYYAHREAELGMMTLFGGFPPRVFTAYEEAFPLEAGWRDRNGLYQLYHLMNHLNLFGRGYHGQVMSVVRRYA